MSLGLLRDVINSKPFQFADMTMAANDVIPYKPNQVGALNLFQPESLFTDVAYISERQGVLSLIPTSPRGGPSDQQAPPKPKIRTVQTYRLSEEDTITAAELFNVAAFHQPNALQNLTTVRNQRLSQMADKMDFTFEHMFLNTLKGTLIDADGSTLVDMFTFFGVTQEPEVAFDLTNITRGLLSKKLAAIKRTMHGHLEADAGRVSHIHILCHPTFFDDFLSNVDILEWASGAGNNSAYLRESRVFGTFEWQGFVFEEYRVGNIATAAGGTWIATDKCIIFPVGPSIYPIFFSPGETFAELGAPGQPRYARAAADPTWDEWIKLKLQSYPLPMCLRPKVLMKGKKGA